MFIAIMESESYQWIALGESEKQAREAIKKEWNKNQQDLERNGYKKAEIKTAEELKEYYGIWTFELNPGECIWE